MIYVKKRIYTTFNNKLKGSGPSFFPRKLTFKCQLHVPLKTQRYSRYDNFYI